jgi:hypothetical protein
MGVTGMGKPASFYSDFIGENPLPRQIGAKNLASVGGRHFICHSGREGGHSRLAGAGLGDTGYIGKKVSMQHRRL